MEKIMSRSGQCAVIRDSGIGVEIEYLGKNHSFPDVSGKKTANYPALIPNWMPPKSRKERAKS